MPVTIESPSPTVVEPNGADVTPTGLSALTGQSTGKVVGSAGDDRGTLYDVQKDTDQVIKLGEGDDVFVFGANDTKVDLNGLVFMGDDSLGFDQVFLNHRVEDYIFTARSEGGIKIQYIGETDGSGDAVTFYGAESFIFRNITADGAINYVNTTFTHDALYAAILAGTAV